MGLRLSLDLLDLDQSFVAVAIRCPGRVDGPAKAVDVGGIHPAVAQVGVMRNGQQLVACLALRVHPLPQVFGVPGVQSAEGHDRHLCTIAEEDIAVQVAVVRRGGVLVRAERRELAGMVVFVGDLDVFLPDRARHLGAHEGFHRRSGEHIHEEGEDLLNVRLIVGVGENKRLRRGQLTQGRSRRVGFFRYPHIFRVVGHTHEVHGRVDLDVVAQRDA